MGGCKNSFRLLLTGAALRPADAAVEFAARSRAGRAITTSEDRLVPGRKMSAHKSAPSGLVAYNSLNEESPTASERPLSVRSRTKLTVVHPPVVIKSVDEEGNAIPPSTIKGSIKMLTGNKLYYGLILVPFACFTQELGLDDAQTFILAAAAILPLAGLLGEATEQVAFHTNETVGGLLNATFGNATELIVCYFALQRGLLLVVQVSLLGSILSNTLLVLGCSMVAAGIRQMQSKFNLVAAQSNTTLLQIAILGLVVPTAMESTGQFAEHSPNDLTLARGISIVLLILYVLYVYFQARPSILPRPAPSPTNPPARPSLVAQLFSHAALFEDTSGEDEDEEPEEARRLCVSLSPSRLLQARLILRSAATAGAATDERGDRVAGLRNSADRLSLREAHRRYRRHHCDIWHF